MGISSRAMIAGSPCLAKSTAWLCSSASRTHLGSSAPCPGDQRKGATFQKLDSGTPMPACCTGLPVNAARAWPAVRGHCRMAIGVSVHLQ